MIFILLFFYIFSLLKQEPSPMNSWASIVKTSIVKTSIVKNDKPPGENGDRANTQFGDLEELNKEMGNIMPLFAYIVRPDYPIFAPIFTLTAGTTA